MSVGMNINNNINPLSYFDMKSAAPAGDTKSVVPMADGSRVTVLRGPARDVLSVTTVRAGAAGGGVVDITA